MVELRIRNTKKEYLLKQLGINVQETFCIEKTFESKGYEILYEKCKNKDLQELENRLDELKSFCEGKVISDEGVILEVVAVASALLKHYRFGGPKVPMRHDVMHYSIDAVAMDLKAMTIHGNDVRTVAQVAFSIYKDLESALRVWVMDGIDVSAKLKEEDQKKLKNMFEVKLGKERIERIKEIVENTDNKLKEMYELLNMSLMNREEKIEMQIEEAVMLKLLRDSIKEEMLGLKISKGNKEDLHHAVVRVLENEKGFVDNVLTDDFCEHVMRFETPFAREIVFETKVAAMIRVEGVEKARKKLSMATIGEMEVNCPVLGFLYNHVPTEERKRVIKLGRAVIRAWGSQENIANGILMANVYLAKDLGECEISEVGRTLNVLDDIVAKNEKQADNYCVPLFYKVYGKVFEDFRNKKGNILEEAVFS